MRNTFLFVLAFLGVGLLLAQDSGLDELKAVQKAKKDSIALIQHRVDSVQKLIDGYPGWKKGVFGTLGVSLSEFNNWYAQGTPNVSSGKIGITANGYANLNREKFFWRNALTMNLSWIKFDDKDDPDDQEGFREATDVFNISSLYGYKLSEKLAASALAEYRTTILSNFNDPGYLDLGVGFTWTPVSNLVVVVHPLNYNFVFSSEDDIYQSSGGAKFMADYSRSFGKLALKSNLSAFVSYEDSNLSNWTWTNAVAYTLWENLGLGFDFGLRDNRQEALDFAINTLGDTGADFDSIDNALQTYWLFGLNYKF